jgi:hypothetical protein
MFTVYIIPDSFYLAHTGANQYTEGQVKFTCRQTVGGLWVIPIDAAQNLPGLRLLEQGFATVEVVESDFPIQSID